MHEPSKFRDDGQGISDDALYTISKNWCKIDLHLNRLLYSVVYCSITHRLHSSRPCRIHTHPPPRNPPKTATKRCGPCKSYRSIKVSTSLVLFGGNESRRKLLTHPVTFLALFRRLRCPVPCSENNRTISPEANRLLNHFLYFSILPIEPCHRQCWFKKHLPSHFQVALPSCLY